MPADRPPFESAGPTGELIRATDWAQTPLGAPGTWPLSLVAQVRAMLRMRQPMCIFWGAELVNLYNDGFLPILGEKHPAAMGQRAEECWREAWSIVGPQLRRVLAGEDIFQEEMLVPIARGGRVEDAWWNYSYSPLFDDSGATAGVLVICTEVTNEVLARRRTEAAKREAELAREELHGVFMQAPVPMVIMSGPEHRCVLANPPYLELIGGRDVIGKTLRDVFTEAEVSYYLPIMNRVLQTGEPEMVHEAPLRLVDRNGVTGDRLIDVGYYPHRDASGKISGVMGVIHDVTATATTRKTLEETNRAKDEFLAMLGHELRNPLAPISTALQLMKSRAGDTLAREREVIERQFRHLARLVDDLLDVSRITRGKVTLTREPLEVGTAISRAIEMTGPLLEERGHQLQARVAPGLWVDADLTRLSQVVANLLTNAARYTPSCGHVAIDARRAGAEVVIEVSDDGIGISAELLPRVFDLFVQGERPLDRPEGGLGLGLALVKNLVQLHGGSVAAHSAGKGFGSRFTLRLPGRAPPAERPVHVAHPELPTAKAAKRVLIVDDNVDSAEMMAELLELVGHQPVVAHDGAQALEKLEGFDATVAFLDIGLPEMDGYELARRIRARGRPIQLIAMTGYGQSSDIARSRAAGFDTHLVKPVVVDEALAAVEHGGG